MDFMTNAGFGIHHPNFPLKAVFQIARDYGHSKIVASLAEKGAIITYLSEEPMTPSANSYLPKSWNKSLQNAIDHALETGDMEGIRWLTRRRRVDINQPMWIDHQTALHYLAIHYEGKTL